jgi:hypothetical protein
LAEQLFIGGGLALRPPGKKGGLMKKALLVISMIALVAGAAVHAQIGKPIPEKPYDIVVQDDETRSFVLINSKTGDYEFVRCSDRLEMYGTGLVKIDGCSLFLQDSQDNHLVVATIDLCSHSGSAAIDVYKSIKGDSVYPPMSERLLDKNMLDSEWECAPILYNPGAPAKPEPPSFLIIQNDEDGSFLFLEPLTGHYKFVHCEDGFTMSGVAVMKMDGCSASLEDISATRVVLASVNICTMEGKAAIKTIPTAKQLKRGLVGMEEYISDNNLTDNTSQCGAKEIIK